MDLYRVIDNNQQSRSCLVIAKNDNTAKDIGAHKLKTWNIHITKINEKQTYNVADSINIIRKIANS